MLKKLFVTDLYLKIDHNQFQLKNLSNNSDWQRLNATTPFSNKRLLIAHFSIAQPLLSDLFKQVVERKLFNPSPRVLVQPLTLTEGGLCEVEQRIFNELVLGAGAYKVVLHCGAELNSQQALALLNHR